MLTPKSSRLKSFSAQTIAVMSKNLLQIDIGLCLAYPDVLISALIGLNTETNPNETILLTTEQASWLGSVALAAQVLGSVFSGFIAESLGRKTALCIVTIPLLFAWILLYLASSLPQIFIAISLFGFSVGLNNSPTVVYVGEVSEVSSRHVLTALTGVSTLSGVLIVYVLGYSANWRSVALYCSFGSILAFIILLFIPETPLWLLSKNRDEAALKSLRWLRGWTSEEAVRSEFDELKSYSQNTIACSVCQKAETNCTHPPPTLIDKFNALFKLNCLRPMTIFLICSLFTNFSGLHHVSPFAAQILKTFNCPINLNKAITLFGLASFCVTIVFVMVIKFVGKRSIYFVSLAGMAVCNLALGIYVILYLPFGTRSYDFENAPVSADEDGSYFPLIVLICSRVFTTGLIEVPFMFCSELFPVKARCFAAGMCSAVFSLVLFITTKTFYDMEKLLSLAPTLCIYGVSAIIGIFALYRIFPHTENASLADIERHFTNKHYKWTDWKIVPHTSTERKR